MGSASRGPTPLSMEWTTSERGYSTDSQTTGGMPLTATTAATMTSATTAGAESTSASESMATPSTPAMAVVDPPAAPSVAPPASPPTSPAPREVTALQLDNSRAIVTFAEETASPVDAATTEALAIAQAAAASERGEDWIREVDPVTNQPYWYNSITGESRWEEEGYDNADSGAVDESAAAADEYSNDYSYGDGTAVVVASSGPTGYADNGQYDAADAYAEADGATEASAAAASAPAPTELAQDEVTFEVGAQPVRSVHPQVQRPWPHPAVWEQALDPDSGMPYYVSSKSGESRWTLPHPNRSGAGEKWGCPSCTLHNALPVLACIACGTDRPAMATEEEMDAEAAELRDLEAKEREELAAAIGASLTDTGPGAGKRRRGSGSTGPPRTMNRATSGGSSLPRSTPRRRSSIASSQGGGAGGAGTPGSDHPASVVTWTCKRARVVITVCMFMVAHGCPCSAPCRY